MEEWRPIDVVRQIDNRRTNGSRASPFWLRRLVRAPIDLRPIRASLLKGEQFFPERFGRMFFAQTRVFIACFRGEFRFQLFAQQGVHHAHRAGRVEHMHRARTVMWSDLHRGVRTACRGAAD